MGWLRPIAVGLAVGTILLSFVAVGLAVVGRLIDERLRPNDDSAVRQMLAGALTLELAALVPLVGWFAVIALIRRRAPPIAALEE